MSGVEHKKFAVVEFTAERSVSAVPSSWVLPSETECFWPHDVSGTAVTELTQSCAKPKENWPKYPARVLTRCNTYRKAKRKAAEAETNSCVETTDAGEPDDGDAVITQETTSSPACSPVRLTLPAPPTDLVGICLQPPPMHSTPHQPASKRRLSGYTQSSISPVPGYRATSEPAGKTRRLQAANSVSPYQEEVLKVLLELRFDMGQLKTQMAAILTGQDRIRARPAVVELAERESDAPPSPPLFILPLTTMEDFEGAESRLGNAADQAMLMKQFSGLEAKSLSGAVRGTMERLMRKSVQINFSGCGRRTNKRAFNKTQMGKVAVAIIREQVTANVVPVEQAIGDYLAGANDREGGRAERMAKKLLLAQAVQSPQPEMPDDPPASAD